MNNQPIEKQDIQNDGSLDVHSVFYTIQGEGPFVGERSIFIRLAGCNLQCPGCDTDYTEKRQRMTAEYIIKHKIEPLIKGIVGKRPLIVITGGEPTRQYIGHLCQLLARSGFGVQIESNGVRKPDPVTCNLIINYQVILVVSPKTSKIHKWNVENAAAFKYVLKHDEIDKTDGLPTRALEHTSKPVVQRPREGIEEHLVFVSPYDASFSDFVNAENKKNMQACIDSCMKFGYRMGVQLHKIIEME